jgi:hypothetical protein
MSLFIFIHHYAPLLCGENPYDFEKTPDKIYILSGKTYEVKLCFLCTFI